MSETWIQTTLPMEKPQARPVEMPQVAAWNACAECDDGVALCPDCGECLCGLSGYVLEATGGRCAWCSDGVLACYDCDDWVPYINAEEIERVNRGGSFYCDRCTGGHLEELQAELVAMGYEAPDETFAC